MKPLNTILILTAFLFQSCLEPFSPDVPDNNENFLVVDATITNQPGPYTVYIRQSTALNGTSPDISGVIVSIEEEQEGITDLLVEVNPGEYQTTFIQGEIGKRYRLNLTFNGRQYQSTWEEIMIPQTIDSIYFEAKTIGTSDRDNDASGLEFFLDTQGSGGEPAYYRFELSETWKFQAPRPSFLDYLGNDMTERAKNPVHTCWSTNDVRRINLANTANLTQNILARHPLRFITGEEDRFTIRYSLLVQQYVISEKEHTFWRQLQESNQELGSIFDRQPSRTLGNIVNTNDPDDLILGYFSASGLSEKRLFVDAAEIPEFVIKRRMCNSLDTLSKFALGPAYEETLVE
ncbi:MAG: DUF4249 domain-containing protein, partial [Bacteroidota bacterium]